MTDIRYNKKYKRKINSLKVPNNLFKIDDTIEISSLENSFNKIKEENLLNSNIINNKIHINIKESFYIIDVFLLNYDFNTFLSKLKSHNFINYNYDNLNLIKYEINEIKDNLIVIFTNKHVLIVSGEWKCIPYAPKQEYEIYACNLCELHTNEENIENIKYIKENKTIIYLTDTTPHLLVYKSNYINVTNLIKYIDCIYAPINEIKIKNWPQINNNKYEELNYSSLIGTYSHKIIQTKESIEKILKISINNLLSHFIIKKRTINNYKILLIEIKKTLYEFYKIKFSEEIKINEKKFINTKLNIIFIIDIIFENDIIELKSGKKNFKDILQILYYFICISFDKKRRNPKLLYFNDYLNKKDNIININNINNVKYSHLIFQSMIIKRNLIGLIENNNKLINEKCTCIFKTTCKQINEMFNINSSKLLLLFIKYIWKCFDIEELEETKLLDVTNNLIIHSTINEYINILNDSLIENNYNNSSFSILVFKNIDESKYQIIDLFINNIKITKAYFINRKNNLYFYKVNLFLFMIPLFGNLYNLELNNNNLELNNINLKISKSTETYKIQRFGLLNSYNCDLFNDQNIINYVKKYLFNNKQILNIINFNERDLLIQYVKQLIESNTTTINSDNNNTDNNIKDLNIPYKFINEYNLLNESQKKALLECLKNKNSNNLFNKITGIHGMPGTGKTKLLILLIKILHFYSKRILVLTFTNRSLENIKNKLSIPTYQTSKTLKSLINLPIDSLIPEFLKYKDTIIFTNINNINDPILSDIQNNKFDYLIIDEGGQLPLFYFLCVYKFCNRIIVVGDHLQLKPVSLFNTSISVLQWIQSSLSVVLDIQYRMDLKIMKLANLMFYNNNLKHYIFDNEILLKDINYLKNKDGSIELINQKTDLDCLFNNILLLINSLNNFKILCFFNRTKEDLNRKIKNYKKNNIGIFNKIDNLNNKQKVYNNDLVETIDRFQGSEEDIIILLLDYNDINDINSCRLRVNVAITRAKHKLIIVGDLNEFYENSSNLICTKKQICINKKGIQSCFNCKNKNNYLSNIPSVILELLCTVCFINS